MSVACGGGKDWWRWYQWGERGWKEQEGPDDRGGKDMVSRDTGEKKRSGGARWVFIWIHGHTIMASETITYFHVVKFS